MISSIVVQNSKAQSIRPDNNRDINENMNTNVKFQFKTGHAALPRSFMALIRLVIRRRSDYIIGFVASAIGPNKSKKLTRLITPVHNIRGKV